MREAEGGGGNSNFKESEQSSDGEKSVHKKEADKKMSILERIFGKTRTKSDGKKSGGSHGDGKAKHEEEEDEKKQDSKEATHHSEKTRISKNFKLNSPIGGMGYKVEKDSENGVDCGFYLNKSKKNNIEMLKQIDTGLSLVMQQNFDEYKKQKNAFMKNCEELDDYMKYVWLP
ncbi:hypothetical protein [Candidatus Hydrogenosomobacter endosymbioticus]|uniref:Uncharacterized protein n=1 Tax=Candidatus Hydrogenosomobacter endosymbioticus TaxID=2558174 RepID=A0ABM7V9T9_9PROT|nr:hypothetical protein [Candidatus Hydrogenosomobacter endosymbioticus]BDB96276.1 hypothetical protein HYD_4090 [Candidatus Hydrogenosomobacter endosymbioticus]